MKAATPRPSCLSSGKLSAFPSCSALVGHRSDFRVLLVLQILTDNLHSSTKEKEKGFQSESTTRGVAAGLHSDPDLGHGADPDSSSSLYIDDASCY